ncbi:MAG: hypothetical protein V9F00_01880 [Nocardioides sp.]|jgi:hypothetical protein
MKRVSAVMASLAVIAGLFGAVAAYRFASAGSSVEQLVSANVTPSVAPTEAAESAKPVVKFKPCKKPAHREGKACVIDVVQDVVLPAAPATSGSGPAKHRDRHESDHGGDDSSAHQGESDHEDSHESDDHEDDDEHDDGGEHESDD